MTVLEDDAFVRLFQERVDLTLDGRGGEDIIADVTPVSHPATTRKFQLKSTHFSGQGHYRNP